MDSFKFFILKAYISCYETCSSFFRKRIGVCIAYCDILAVAVCFADEQTSKQTALGGGLLQKLIVTQLVKKFPVF
jgi:hypothetical protein